MNETRTYDEILQGDQEQKVPIRMLERRILSFTQTTVPHDLNRLKQHKENIILYHKDCNWAKLNIEQVNASRTVQVIFSCIEIKFTTMALIASCHQYTSI